jgi:O-acetylhomoserine (thiol)-lyase
VAIGGVLVDGGRFDWEASGRFPTLTEPYPGYPGVTYSETFGPQAFAARARTEGVRDFGACMAPQTAFYLLLGLETLPLRIERHVRNTAAVLDFLQANPTVTWISHPTLPKHPDHALAQRLLPKGAGSIVSFGVRGGRAAGARFIEACRLASHLANVGDAKTLVIHPASTTHLQLGVEQLRAAGIGEDMIRLSVGLEDPQDIIDDLARALRAAEKG